MPLQSLREVSLDLFSHMGLDQQHLLPAESQWLASMPNLTKVELYCVKTVADVECLRSLPLQHISLRDSALVELGLFVPGALTQLTSLCIRSKGLPFEFQSVMSEEETAKAFYDAGTAILNMPNLREIECEGPLFEWGLRSRPKEGLEFTRYKHRASWNYPFHS